MKADFFSVWRCVIFVFACMGASALLSAQPESSGASPASEQPTLFSFRGENVPIRQALALFARANQLNIVLDLDVTGEVTVEFADLPLDLAMRALLEANGYYFVQDRGLIRVRNRETRLFHVDYIQTTRSGQGSNAVQISSGGSAAGGSGGAGGGSSGGSGGGSEQGSTMTLTATSTINFWDDLEEQVRALVGESGTVTVNGLAGTVLVTSSHRLVEEVAHYLDSITNSVLRQIDLEVEIFELALNDASQLGINWSWVSEYLNDATFSTLPGVTGLTTAGGLIIQRPVFGPPNPTPAYRGEYDYRGIRAVLEAVQQLGTLKIVSKPRLRTLNNQPAVVRVGQDIPVFLRQVTISGDVSPIVTESESIQTVTVGTVLSITPQVSADGLITLDVTPAVSRLVRIDSSASGNTTAPVIDIRQASSIVRLRDGDTIVMGGLVQEGEYLTQRKVPFLGSLPVVGKALFSSEAKTKERSELVFFLTPRIVHTEAVASN